MRDPDREQEARRPWLEYSAIALLVLLSAGSAYLDIVEFIETGELRR